MNTLWILTIANLKMFVRNKQAMFFTLFTPILIMAVFGFIGFDSVPKIQVGYSLDAPPTAGTQMFLDNLRQVEAFEVFEGAEFEERQALEDGDRAVTLIVPHDLIPETPSVQTRKITILTNVGEQQQAGTAIGIINQFLNQTTLQLTQTPTLFETEVIEINARNLRYIDFLVPGIIALSLMQMAVFSVSFVFVELKEKGVLKRLLATPMRPYQFVISNVVTRLIVAVAQAALLIAVGVLLFGSHMEGSYLLLLLVVILGAIMFLGLGFAISGFAKTVESVPAVANLIIFPMFFLGGTFFPLETMPGWLAAIASYMPLTYLSDSLRQVMTNDASFSMIAGNIWWMLAWSIALVTLANFTFGFEEKRVG